MAPAAAWQIRGARVLEEIANCNDPEARTDFYELVSRLRMNPQSGKGVSEVKDQAPGSFSASFDRALLAYTIINGKPDWVVELRHIRWFGRPRRV